MEFGRGKLTTHSDRIKVVEAIEIAIHSGARLFKACEVVGISERTYQRWYRNGAITKDKRPDAIRPEPINKLSEDEEIEIVELMNLKEHRNLSPSQVVFKVMDEQKKYYASVSTVYRVLRHYGMINHRGRSNEPQRKPITTHSASGPNEVWMWDITWLPGHIKGIYYYLYMIIDLFSRKIVGWEIWENESSELASKLVKKAVYSENALVLDRPLVLHSDNGSPMKGSSLLTTLHTLGIVKSNSRPRVSNDNAYIESLFKTVKYMPSFPYKGFKNIQTARQWVDSFVEYYNNDHRHSSLKHLTPQQRHNGEYVEILKQRKEILEQARAKNPERWSGPIQNCELENIIWLNPVKKESEKKIS